MRVVIADDAALFREGLARLLESAGFEVGGRARNPAELFERIDAERPDVAIVDIRMPPTHTREGLEAARRLQAEHPEVGVLVLSQYVEAQYALQLLEARPAGAGYLLKDRVADVEELADALRRIGSGGLVIDHEVVAQLVARRRARNPVEQLTERERQVLALMAEGRSNLAISARLFLSPKTVEAHVRSIFSRLDLPATPDDHRRVLAVVAFLSA